MQYQVEPTDQTQENDQKPHFGTLDHSKMLPGDFWMILHDLVVLPNVGKHIVLSSYAISSRSINPKSRKPRFWHFGSFKRAFFVIFEWSSMTRIMAKLLRPFSIMRICNMKSIRVTKPKIWTQKWMDHSKQPTRRTPKNVETEREFSRTCGFRGVAQKWMLYHIEA